MPANISDQTIAILCNPLAGTGKAVHLAELVARTLKGREIRYDLFSDNWPVLFDGFTDIWIVGGDGTLHYFVNQYPDIKLPLVIFKGGTGNDFHWLLYGNMQPTAQLEMALYTPPKPIDLGRCNNRFFINGLGIGFEGDVARSLTGKKKRPGKASFFGTVLQKIFTYQSRSYKIRVDNQSFKIKKYLLADASNGCRAGGGFHIAPQASADDGLLDIILVDAMSPLRRLRWLPVIEKGKHISLPFIHYVQAKRLIVESELPIQAHLDGEYFEAEKIEVEILKHKLLFRFQ